MQEQSVDHVVAVEAQVNEAATVTLYDDEGHPLAVPGGDVAVWVARGYRLSPRRTQDALADLPALWSAALAALTEAAQGVEADGHLDTSAEASYAAAIIGLRELNTGLAAVLDGLHVVPVKQDAGVESAPDAPATA